jgi:methyl-accepting chemotaxis protein
MSKLKLKQKIGLGFGVLLAILGVVGFVSYSAIADLDTISREVDRIQEKVALGNRVGFDIERSSSATRGYILTGDAKLLKWGDEGKADLKSAFDELTQTVTSEQGKKLLVELQQATDQLAKLQDFAIDYRRNNDSKGAQDELFSDTADETRQALRRVLKEFNDFEEKLQDEGLQKQKEMQSRSRILTIGFSVAGVFVGVLVAFLMGRSIALAIQRMLGLINEIAANNLAVADLEVTSEDELGHAIRALNGMKNSLGEVMRSIASSSERLASASEEISASATEQAAGSDTQRDQTGQVATAMQEMSSTILEISGNSSKAADAARKASDTARQGGKIVEETLGKMRGIAVSVEDTAKKVNGLGTRSNQIGQIIGVIDDIADQTNLLALNAAIEAARAGEQGRGFAVVADEVRKLAERTSKATKEIAAMIQSIQAETKSAVEAMEAGTKQVEAGVETTQEAGKSLHEIIESAEQVGEMVTHIATAATEQSAATEEVNTNLEQIAKITGETAEGAQQSAKACHELSSLALDLQNLVSQFKLSSDEETRWEEASGEDESRRIHRSSTPAKPMLLHQGTQKKSAVNRPSSIRARAS